MGTANGDWWHIKTINATLVSISRAHTTLLFATLKSNGLNLRVYQKMFNLAQSISLWTLRNKITRGYYFLYMKKS